MQNLQTALARIGTLGTGNMQMFAAHLSQEQLSFSTAHQAIRLCGHQHRCTCIDCWVERNGKCVPTFNRFINAINNMKVAHLNIASIQTAYKNDLQQFTSATQDKRFPAVERADYVTGSAACRDLHPVDSLI